MSKTPNVQNATLEYFEDLVRWNVRNANDEQLLQIAQNCFDANAAGENGSVWHQTAKFFGTKCHCGECEPAQEPMQLGFKNES